uniref:Baseplate wedge subunit n=1 Tax=Rhizobium phage IG49 TaxID=3129228 RepID=A0AAU8HYG2_9CAUD
MAPRIHLEVTKDEKGFLIDGKRNYGFEAGVEYHLFSETPMWATWTDGDLFTKVESGKTDVVEVYNLTCPDHHRYNNDSQLYYIWMTQIGAIGRTPIGLINKEIPDIVPIVPPETKVGGSGWNGIIEEHKKYLTNNTFEELFNLEQVKYIPPKEVEFINSEVDVTPYQFKDSQRYISVSVDGRRVESKLYSAEFLPGSDMHKIFFKNYIDGEIITKTDLCHNVYENGSTHIRVLFREGDERTFYLSDEKKSFDSFLECKGMPSPDHRIETKSLFDSFVLDQYPNLFEFIQSYYDVEGFAGTAQSYLRNMMDYSDVDKMPEEELAKKIRMIFTPTTDDGSDPRLLVKRLVDFFSNKGNLPSYKWLSNVLFKKESSLHRFSKYVLKLSDAEWHSLTRITLSGDDIAALLDPSFSRVFETDDATSIDEMASKLEGFTIEGRTSQTEAVVEYVEKQIFQRQVFYHVYVTVQFGEFFQNEPIDVKNMPTQITINSKTYNSEFFGIIGFDIVQPGNKYIPGQEIKMKTTTGDGFSAYISRVGNKGEAKEIIVSNPGWFFQPREEDKPYVEDDFGTMEKEFDPAKIFDEKIEFLSGNIGYVNVGWKPEIIKQAPSGGITIGDRWTINRNNVAYPTLVASATIDSKLMFFGVALNSKNVIIMTAADEQRILDWVPEGDEELIGITANDRTLFILGQRNIYSFDLRKVLAVDLIPPQKFVLNTPEYGVVTSIFSLGSILYAFADGKIVSLNYKGDKIESHDFPGRVDFSSYTRRGDFYNLFFSIEGNLFIYQWYDGNPRLKANPIYGRVEKVKRLKNGIMNTLSSYSVFNDNDVYQDFSLAIKMDVFTNTYMKTYDETINTSGFKHYGLVKRKMNDLSTGSPVLYLDQEEG